MPTPPSQDCEEIVERDTDKLVRISKTSDEWTLRPADRSGACQLGWEVAPCSAPRRVCLLYGAFDCDIDRQVGLAVASGTHYRLGAERYTCACRRVTRWRPVLTRADR
jgi:hypothetical protein